MPVPAGSSPVTIMSGPIVYDPDLSRVRLNVGAELTPLNANPGFEVDTSGWTGQSATIARSTAQAHAGVASLLITPDGVAASGGAIADRVATIPAAVYRASMWVYSPGGWSDLRPAVDWWTALSGGSFISTSLGTGFVVPAGVWTYLEQTFTAPAGANAAQMRARHGGTPTAANTWHADEIAIAEVTIPAHADVVRIERSTDEIVWTTVRGGTTVVVVASVAKLDDYEFAADVLNHYRILAAQLLNANPTFETTVTPWTGQGGTVVRSTAQFHEGVASGLLTPDGVTPDVAVFSEMVAAAAFSAYRARAWVRCAVSRSVDFGFDWYATGPVFLSQSVMSVALTANTWTLLDFEATAPASTAFVQLKAAMHSTPAAGHLLHIDEAYLTGPAETTLWAGSITPVLDGVWLKSLARPFLNRKVTPRDFSPMSRASRGGVFPIVGRSAPVAVTELHGSRRWTLELNAYTDQEAEALDLLISTGEVQFVHVPTTGRLSAVPGGYVALGDTAEEVLPTIDLKTRVFSLSLTQVAAPGPDVIPAIGLWSTVINTYASWNAVLAAHPSWSDLLQLTGSPADVVVP